MYQPPLFRDDILLRIANNFHFYLTTNNWGSHFLLICLVLGAFLLLLRPNHLSYADWQWKQTYVWQKTDLPALIFPAAVLIFFMVIFYMQEYSIFSIPDLMSHLNLDIFKNGVTPVYGHYNRVRPFGFWENNIFYAISENMHVLNLTVWLSVLAFMAVMYFWLDFIPVKRRLTLIGLVILLPGYFWLNNIIFNERIWLIEVILSLIFLRRFLRRGTLADLAAFAVLMNISLYSKETVTLFYAGILAVFGLEKILTGKIVPKDFLHPVRLLRKCPAEVMLFLSLLFFFVFYHLILFSVTDSAYLDRRTGCFLTLLRLYWYETAVSIAAAAIFIFRLARHKIIPLREGIAAGSLAVTSYVYYLKLVPESHFMDWRSYYLIIPGIFLTVYVFNAVKNLKWFYFLIILSVLYSVSFNLAHKDITEGKEYRGVAEFIDGTGSSGSTVNLYMSPHSELNIWWYGAWASALKYTFPARTINIKLYALPEYEDELTIIFYQKDRENYQPLHIVKEKPQKGDYYLLRRNQHYSEDLDFIKSQPVLKVYGNRSFEIYQIL